MAYPNNTFFTENVSFVCGIGKLYLVSLGELFTVKLARLKINYVLGLTYFIMKYI